MQSFLFFLKTQFLICLQKRKKMWQKPTNDVDPFLSRCSMSFRRLLVRKFPAWSDVQLWPRWCCQLPRLVHQFRHEQKHPGGPHQHSEPKKYLSYESKRINYKNVKYFLNWLHHNSNPKASHSSKGLCTLSNIIEGRDAVQGHALDNLAWA